jgi:hypothetical protein
MPSRERLADFAALVSAPHHGRRKGARRKSSSTASSKPSANPAASTWCGATEFRIRKADEDGGGTAFADYVWKPVVLIEMKKRGENLQKHYRQAFDYWTRLVPNRPSCVVLCNFDQFGVYDFETDLDAPKDTLALSELPNRWGPLAFLASGSLKLAFENDREIVTCQGH